jgi:translocation and assembly module TamB
MGLIRGEDTPLQGEVDIEGSLSSSDLSWASKALPKLRRLRGKLEGEVKLKGEVRKPEVAAEIHIDKGEVSYTGVPLLSSLDVDLQVAGESLEVKKATGELGGAPFELAGGISPGGDEGPVFDLELKGKSILAYRDRGIRIRADADITAKGPLSKLEIGGSAALVDSHFIRNVDFLGSVGGVSKPKVEGKGLLFSFKEPPLSNLVFDLSIVAKDPFQVKNQYVRGFIRPDLHLGGTGEMPALLGKVYVDPFRIYLPTGTIRTDPGFVIFKQGEPDRPWLELRGRSKMMGYDINMRVDGFYDEPKMTFSSTPPASDAELLLLVLTGTPPSSGDVEAAGSAGSAIAVFLGRGFLGRFFGGGEEAEDMIMDRFETQFGRDITESGDPTIDMTFRMTEDILWKGGTLYLTSEKDRYDDLNYGVRFLVQIKNKEKD